MINVRGLVSDILKEVSQHLNIPYRDIQKVNKFEYNVIDGDIILIYEFRRRFGGDLIHLPKIVDQLKVKEYYEIQWYEKNNNALTNEQFLRASATMLTIIKDFKTTYNIDIVMFGSLTKGHESIYSGNTFKKVVDLLFNDKYLVEDSTFWIINKAILKDSLSVIKRADRTSLDESREYWNNKYKNSSNSVKLKRKIKEEIVNQIFKIN